MENIENACQCGHGQEAHGYDYWVDLGGSYGGCETKGCACETFRERE